MDLTYIVLLLPGFLTEKLIASFSYRKERNQFEALTSSIVYSFIIVLCAFCCQFVCNRIW